jgi:AhpD family alkylhydroperoxidase
MKSKTGVTMKSRMCIKEIEPRVYEAMDEADARIERFGLDPVLVELLRLRVSQINGCGYCIDYHAKNALRLGERLQRLLAMAAWWETPFFSEKEMAALTLAEEITLIPASRGLSDKTYERVRGFFGDKEIAQLIFVIVAINSWNRIAISTHMVADTE